LFFNAGDEFQGTLFYTIYKGEKIADTLNQLGFGETTPMQRYNASLRQ
jgi:2',3'-cyclic-nucleotide 2'-phosphodiesterase (5'-nucleotidase family)